MRKFLCNLLYEALMLVPTWALQISPPGPVRIWSRIVFWAAHNA